MATGDVARGGAAAPRRAVADERLRELERRWKEGGGLDAHVQLLAARVRAGELVKERVRLAAFLGDAAARLALGDAPPPVPAEDHAWALELLEGIHEANEAAGAGLGLELSARLLQVLVALAVDRQPLLEAVVAANAYLAGERPAPAQAMEALAETLEALLEPDAPYFSRPVVARALIPYLLEEGDPVLEGIQRSK